MKRSRTEFIVQLCRNLLRRFECCFCHREAKPVTQTWVQRARAHMMARQRLMAIWESTHA